MGPVNDPTWREQHAEPSPGGRLSLFLGIVAPKF
jgi:hypothetical protein